MAAPANDAPDVVANLKQTLANIAQEVQNETAYMAQNGPRPTYSLGNRNVSWNEWLTTRLKAIDDLNATIIKLDQPFELNTRYYS